ncbi:AfsR/SARP family transcriptional regulator [Amycolatopsis tucumanensis]|uniref:OmpR/PhoB-type domain-containing protein n=1 Tax=Amycolatopsis tucumanensis TaxID=401106 RepID=A0ABP7HI84_9PSEU|nr:AfsR/SARP family transcriptional regulator [Amycolatopsis tucumanensis]MCF6425436.1 AfsR/SARP family transcriptional regulator [Amycolatopsis tucumanensis]
MMSYEVLGPLAVNDHGEAFTPTAPKQRQLLAFLLLNANTVVSIESCIAELWEDNPPSSAASTLQTYVLQLRRLLASLPSVGSAPCAKDVLRTRSRGYLLRVAPGQLDVDEFNSYAAQGRAALARRDDGCAALFFRRALSVWHGEPLADVALGPRLRAWVAGLEERRLGALEQRIEADLRLGTHHEVLAELTALVAAHPTHENFHAQLVLALYRCGRQAQALQVIARLRSVLNTELGLEPSARMQQLHQAVLTCDARLDASVEWPESVLSLDLLAERRGELADLAPGFARCLEGSSA